MIKKSYAEPLKNWVTVMLPRFTTFEDWITQKSVYEYWLKETGVKPYEGTVVQSDRYILREDDAVMFKLKFGL